MNKINVLQVCNRLGIGGTEKALQIFTENLDKSIFDVYVCGVMQGGEREKLLREKGFEVYIIDKDQQKLIKLMKEKNIQIVHIHRAGHEEPFVIMAAKKAKVPVIIETNVFGLVDNSQSGILLDHHLFISKMCALRYQKWTRISNEEFFKTCKVLYNPVNLDDFEKNKISDTEIQKLKESLGINQDEPIIGRIGRPDIGKWGDICLDMMRYLIKKVPNVKYIVVGAPESTKDGFQKHEISKNLVFLKPLSPDEVIKFYNLVDVLAHSSKIGESFGYTIAEAMAAQKPVIVNSTPLSDNAQVELIDNGITGFVANSPKDYAEVIGYLLKNKNKAREMGLAGYEKVKREYESKKTAKILEKIYIDLLRKKGIEFNDEIAKKYEKIEYSPSKEDIYEFKREYEKRLKDCFGGASIVYKFEIFGWKYFIDKPLIIHGLKKLINATERRFR